MIERPFFGAGARHANDKHYAVSFLCVVIPDPSAARESGIHKPSASEYGFRARRCATPRNDGISHQSNHHFFFPSPGNPPGNLGPAPGRPGKLGGRPGIFGGRPGLPGAPGMLAGKPPGIFSASLAISSGLGMPPPNPS